MAANGISTLPTKEQRKSAKISLAEIKRSTGGPMYRQYNVYVGTVSPTLHRPWSSIAVPTVNGGNSNTTSWDDTIDGELATTSEVNTLDGGFAV